MQEVWREAGRVQKKGSADVFEGVNPGNGACYIESGQDFFYCSDPVNAVESLLEGAVGLIGQADGAGRLAGMDAVAGQENVVMAKDGGVLHLLEGIGYSPGVVVMPMAEHERPRLPEVDAECLGVWGEGFALSGVKKHRTAGRFQPEREAMFGD